MDKLKVMTIVGTRPEIIRLSETIKKCDKYFNHTLVHTGQNWDYALNEIFFEDLELRQPDVYMDAVGENLGETIGNIIAKSYKILMEIQPDALLILGDTNSALSAIAAKRLKIPIFHMEAGNRCFDENLPEETNRRIVDHIADVNLCYSEHARRYLNIEGTTKERTYVVGSPMAEVLSANLEKIRQSKVLDTLQLESGRYILLSAHREENIDTERNFLALMDAVNAMAETYQMPVIYSVHPRSRKFIEARQFKFHPLVRTLQPFGFSDYNHLQMNAFCVVSDSGTLPEESSYFNRKGIPFPAVCVRTSTERPEAIDKGNFILGSITTEQVLQAVDMAVEMRANEDDGVDVPDYIDENVSTKVVKIIQSYTGIVNKMVWRKEDV
ncbi:UDP-N-acetylglucosamine 2-epimerase [Lachnospiraceae bacterium M18-1]|nr:UDP-N-acetylglucosamine 2-epimerase [Lachnospiraceae bacterium M18-1]